MSIVIKISGLDIELDTKSEYIKAKCADYLSDSTDAAMKVNVSREKIEKEKKSCPGFSDDYYEFVCMYREICLKMPLYNRMLIHSAVIDHKGRGYSFAAKSGVGKTTHIRMWKQTFGDDVSIINGDKPVYWIEQGKVYAYGTPWCGKEGYNLNRGTEIKAISFIERGQENRIEKMKPEEAADLLFGQILLPNSAEGATRTLELCSSLLKTVPVYKLYCNISTDAAIVAKSELEKA